MTKDLKCEVCHEPAVGVCSSGMGPISHAFCKECLVENRVPWSTLVGGLYGCRKGHVAEYAKAYIEGTCEFYDKTEDELWAEVEKLEEDYENHVRGMQEAGPDG